MQIVPNKDNILFMPKALLFKDKPRLLDKFDKLLESYVIERPQFGWKAMCRTGVQLLSNAVTSQLVTSEIVGNNSFFKARFSERKDLLDRVIKIIKSTQQDGWNDIDWDDLNFVTASRLSVQFSINILGRHYSGKKSETNVFIERQQKHIYLTGNNPDINWNLLAAELASWINPIIEGGILSSPIKEVLIAKSMKEAIENLDELGFSNFINHDCVPAKLEIIDFPDEANISISSADIPIKSGAKPDGINFIPEIAPATIVPKSNKGSDPSTKTKDEAVEQKIKKRLRSYVSFSDQRNGSSERESYADEEVDRLGIRAVLDFETQQERQPDEQPHLNFGYDIVSYDIDGNIERYIEVKSLAGKWSDFDIEISRKQHETAQQLGNLFWLYVVEQAKSNTPKIIRINHICKHIDKYCFDSSWELISEEGLFYKDFS